MRNKRLIKSFKLKRKSSWLYKQMKQCMTEKDFEECKAVIVNVLYRLPEDKKEGLIDRLLEVLKWQAV